MKLPRLKISSVMVVVAIAALELAAIRAFEYGIEDRFVFDALPTVNILVFVGIVGFRRWRTFTAGFVVVGTLSLLAYQIMFRDNPWTWLRYFEPPLEAIDRHVVGVFPNTHLAIMYAIVVVFFAIPHTVLGLVGGFLIAKGWAIMERRRSA